MGEYVALFTRSPIEFRVEFALQSRSKGRSDDSELTEGKFFFFSLENNFFLGLIFVNRLEVSLPWTYDLICRCP